MAYTVFCTPNGVRKHNVKIKFILRRKASPSIDKSGAKPPIFNQLQRQNRLKIGRGRGKIAKNRLKIDRAGGIIGKLRRKIAHHKPLILAEIGQNICQHIEPPYLCGCNKKTYLFIIHFLKQENAEIRGKNGVRQEF